MTNKTYLRIESRDSMRSDVIESITLRSQEGAEDVGRACHARGTAEPGQSKFVFRKSKCIICQKWKFEGQLTKSGSCYTCRRRNIRYYQEKNFYVKNQKICRFCWPFDCGCRL